MPERKTEQWTVHENQEPVHGVTTLLRNPPPHEVEHQHGDERHGEAGSGGHRVRLGERQWSEQLAFLGFERKDRYETQRDDEQAEKQYRPDLDSGFGDQPRLLCGCRPTPRIPVAPNLEM